MVVLSFEIEKRGQIIAFGERFRSMSDDDNNTFSTEKHPFCPREYSKKITQFICSKKKITCIVSK